MEIKNILIIIAIVAAVFGVIVYLLPYLKKKGVNVDKTMQLVSTGLDTADKVVDSLQTFMPNTTYLPIVDKIIEYAQKGYEYAEQLNNIGKIEKGEAKKEAATKYVYDALKLAGINTESEQVKSIIDGSIEAAVYASKSSTGAIATSATETVAVSKSEE
jgi:flagellar motor component MotA